MQKSTVSQNMANPLMIPLPNTIASKLHITCIILLPSLMP